MTPGLPERETRHMEIRELLEQRAKHIADARAILDKADTEKRELTADEQSAYDKHFDEANRLKARADREERQQAAEREVSTIPPRKTPGAGDPPEGGDEKRKLEIERRALNNYLRAGFASMNPDERRALEAGSDAAGGYLMPGRQFVGELLKAVDDLVYMRQWARTFQTNGAETLGVPSLDADPADSDWTTELATGNEDSSMGFGGRELHPHPLAKRLKVSNKLMRNAVISPEELVRERLAYKFGVTQEKAFLVGHGANQPLGIFTASANGISTGRDVTAGSTTLPTTDGLIDVKYKLKPAYWNRARWLCHRDVQKEIAKLKDTTNQYLWRESVRVGEPDTLLGRPIFMSEFCPNTLTTGQYVIAFGDFSFYWIADSLAMQIQRLTELYAETNQTGFIGRLETDGMPVLEEAFVRGKLA